MTHPTDRCLVPPAPQLRARLRRRFEDLRAEADETLAPRLGLRDQDRPGFNDGLIVPGRNFPLGTPALVARRAARSRPQPLRGQVRVLVVLADFPDVALPEDAVERAERLFFSRGELEHGSVVEYFDDVSRGAVEICGEVVGPLRLPRTLREYAGSKNGTQNAVPNARTMADEALTELIGPLSGSSSPAAEQGDGGPGRPGFDTDLTRYDNDRNGYVDAYVVVHAGRGAEETGAPRDLWSHKWVLPEERPAGGVDVYGYLTVPEDAKLGVCAHELGHLLFGWPDLYDTDATSSGIGDFCLMAGGSWGLDGERPVHPSAWCKATQGWATVVNRTDTGRVSITDVKAGGDISRLWKDGQEGQEYFLVENRQPTGYDASLPGGGLLIWHVDDSVEGNAHEPHYQVGLVQADGRADLEAGRGDGDDGDPWPGSTGATTFDDASAPSSKSYAGAGTCVAVVDIGPAGETMTATLRVRCEDG